MVPNIIMQTIIFGRYKAENEMYKKKTKIFESISAIAKFIQKISFSNKCGYYSLDLCNFSYLKSIYLCQKFKLLNPPTSGDYTN